MIEETMISASAESRIPCDSERIVTGIPCGTLEHTQEAAQVDARPRVGQADDEHGHDRETGCPKDRVARREEEQQRGETGHEDQALEAPGRTGFRARLPLLQPDASRVQMHDQ